MQSTNNCPRLKREENPSTNFSLRFPIRSFPPRVFPISRFRAGIRRSATIRFVSSRSSIRSSCLTQPGNCTNLRPRARCTWTSASVSLIEFLATMVGKYRRLCTRSFPRSNSTSIVGSASHRSIQSPCRDDSDLWNENNSYFLFKKNHLFIIRTRLGQYERSFGRLFSVKKNVISEGRRFDFPDRFPFDFIWIVTVTLWIFYVFMINLMAQKYT